jgi:hypothetical protein
MIASHHNTTLQQADELLRDAVFENLLDQARLKVEETARRSPASASVPLPMAVAPATAPSTAIPAAVGTVAAAPVNGASEDKAVEVIIIQDPGEREAVPTVIGNVKPEGNQKGDSTVPPARTSFSRLQPRGIGG